MTEVITIGLDLAKNVFQIHGVDGLGSRVEPDRPSRIAVPLGYEPERGEITAPG